MALIYGQLEKAQLEILSAPPASAPLGYVYFDSTLNSAQVKTSTGWVDATQPGTALLTSGGTITGALTVNGAASLSTATILGAATVSGLATLSAGFSAAANSAFSSGYGIVTSGGLIAGSLIGVQSFSGATSSTSLVTGTYTPTAGTRMILVELIGGGGAGGNSSVTSASGDDVRAAGAGGGGAYIRAFVKDIRSAGNITSMTYSVGYGGQKSTSANASGGTGGPTQFTFGSVTLTASGGSGGSYTSSGVNWYRKSDGGGGGLASSVGSDSRLQVIESINGSAGGDTLAFFDIHGTTSQYISMIQAGSGGTPAHICPAPAQISLVYDTLTNSFTSFGDSSAARTYGVGGFGSGVIQQQVSATGQVGGPGRILIYEYA